MAEHDRTGAVIKQILKKGFFVVVNFPLFNPSTVKIVRGQIHLSTN